MRLVRVFTDQPGTGDLDGFLSRQQLDRAGTDWTEAEAFVCGPTPLMDSARALFDRPDREDHLHTEVVHPDPVRRRGRPVDGAVRFAESEIGVASDGRPLLLQAEAAGLAPLSGCRMGICHTCTRQLDTGVVRDIVTGELTTGPDVNIRICVSVPVGDVEIDLYPDSGAKRTSMTTVAEAHGLTPEQLDALAHELEALRAEVAAQLGTDDVATSAGSSGCSAGPRSSGGPRCSWASCRRSG